MAAFETRQVGRTGVHVTTLGLGTATMGGNRTKVTQATAEAIVRAAWDAGVRYVDTAPFYGLGFSERRVGDALRGEDRDSWVLSTKVGRLLHPRVTKEPRADGWMTEMPFEVVYDYSYDGIMRSVEDSYQRLGLARIDLLFVHDIGAYQHGKEANAPHMKALRESGRKALDKLKADGTIRGIGLGVNEKEVILEVMSWADWDVMLLAGRYTLLEQGPLDDLLPLCQQRGTSIVVGGPLNSGILAGRDTWNYAPAPPEIRERARRLGEICARHRVALPAAALQFPLAHPAVAAVIPGPRNADEFRANLGHFRAPIPAALWQELKHEGLIRHDAPVPA
ncbi:MAG TPA: aldo/keto reductase [Acetobacteraceae bacterium]|nr:aldo/keto reductase [Acetobacteraceae bacterium]